MVETCDGQDPNRLSHYIMDEVCYYIGKSVIPFICICFYRKLDNIKNCLSYLTYSSYLVCRKNMGLVRDLNPGPRAPEARIIPLDQRADIALKPRHTNIGRS